MDSLKQLLTQPWFNAALGLVGGITGIIGIVLFLVARSRSRIAAQITSLELVGVNSVLPNEIEFLFRGNKVPKVTLSRVAVWNIGNTTLKGDQIVAGDPLRIVTSEHSEILETTVLGRTRQVNEFSCNRQQDLLNEATCMFDYLDPEDGALIQVIHTGTDKVKVVGTLRGIRKRILVTTLKTDEKKKAELRAGSRFIMKFIGIFFFVSGLGLQLFNVVLSNVDPFILIGGCSVTVAGIYFYWGARFMAPYALDTQIVTVEPKKSFWSSLFRK